MPPTKRAASKSAASRQQAAPLDAPPAENKAAEQPSGGQDAPASPEVPDPANGPVESVAPDDNREGIEEMQGERAQKTAVATDTAREAAPHAHPVSDQAAAPHAATPATAGRRFVTEGGDDLTTFADSIDSTAETIVTMGRDVYEQFAAPGAPNRTVKRLLFHKGQRVPKSALKRAEDEARANADEASRLRDVEAQHAAEVDSRYAFAETKEGEQRGETKEGARGSIPRR